jgi:aquaporin Z
VISVASAKAHWAEYGIETASLACFMIAALGFGALLEHPASPVRLTVANPILRRAFMGIAMGLTSAAIIYSPWGRRSGAHLNPSVTLSYLRLGKITSRDALFYVLAQFAGGCAGVAAMALALRRIISVPSVNYVATVPGPFGWTAAFVAEGLISFLMMWVILHVSNRRGIARFTGAFAACLVALYITLEAPVSGMSMNPARSFAPALAAGVISSLWIYFVAPPLGMMLAADLYVRVHGRQSVRCAKLHHPASGHCHFACDAQRGMS